MADQPPIQDFTNGIDYTSGPLSATLLNQGFSLLVGNFAPDLGSGLAPIIWTLDTALNVPNVPNPSTGKSGWTRYFWMRLPFFTGATQSPGQIYTWNDDAINDATYLKWISTSFDDTAILAQLTVLTTQVNTALNAAATANTNSTNALNNANSAVTVANNAANSVAAATAAASAASLAATAANNTANAASTSAAAANAVASAAQTSATNANTVANAALLAVNVVGHKVIYAVAGTFNWMCPVGISTVTVKLWGGGADGGLSNVHGGAPAGGFGGGGSGQYCQSVVPVVAGTIYSITVGVGGTPGGTVAANSTFATSTVVAAAGVRPISAAGGLGGTTGIGTIQLNGNNGFATNTIANTSGQGGDSPNGFNGGFGLLAAGGSLGSINAGGYGAGGGGASSAPSGGADGGIGGVGRCELNY